ncbi:DUF1737 domain-containing protein [Acinetobacter baumannii]|uniref:DUF1737 domain-containing protein n=1 Tax=Acinetobacter baumannii TaxID=470 RepID=UPI0012FAF7C7|nr:DUF1737 domain-containing protein [Acinetobacter baumannii]MVU32045.1 DUF1737 domain-containing protein [Acinetobacter baumannii]
MKLYRYLTGPDDSAFCARVTKALNHGWELYEAPTMTFNGSQVIVGQAICKTIDKNYDPEMDIFDVLKNNA